VQTNNASNGTLLGKELTHVIIQLTIIGFLLVMAYKIASPFLGLILWGLVLAVALYPLQRKLVKRIGGREGKSATIIVLIGLLLIGVPTVMMGLSSVEYVENGRTALESGTISIKPPPESVSQVDRQGCAQKGPRYHEKHCCGTADVFSGTHCCRHHDGLCTTRQ
jgi:hypothetical protein